MLLDLTVLPTGWEGRFWARVGVTADLDTCWLWRNAPMNGRPVVALPASLAAGRSMVYAYRVASALVYGPLPADVVVRHTCDTPMCCNPWHLLRGTQQDNIRDAVERGKFRSRQRRFSDEQVQGMRQQRLDGATLSAIARFFATDASTVRRITSRQQYRDVV